MDYYKGLIHEDKLTMKLPLGNGNYKDIDYYNPNSPKEHLAKDLLGLEKYYKTRFPIFREIPTDAVNLILDFAFYFRTMDKKEYDAMMFKLIAYDFQFQKEWNIITGMCVLLNKKLFCSHLLKKYADKVHHRETSIILGRKCNQENPKLIFVKHFDGDYSDKSAIENAVDEIQIFRTICDNRLLGMLNSDYILFKYCSGRKGAKMCEGNSIINSEFRKLLITKFIETDTTILDLKVSLH